MTQEQHSLHWLDKLVAGILSWQKKTGQNLLHVDDMKTPSGRVHVGSLRGVVLHDLVAKVLSQKSDQEIISTYVFNDMDPMDGLPTYLDQNQYQPEMGKPLYQIDAPQLDESGIDFSTASSAEKEKYQQLTKFSEFYAQDFMDAYQRLGCDQKTVWSHEVYQSGQMDETIRLALDNVETLKKIYKEVADYQLPLDWYPFQVTCPQCGKVGTTTVIGWDGEEVEFQCQKQKVEWAEGCGHQGKISPFGGNGKLLWKVDWPAHWRVLGVNIEGAGKDHTSAGGSRDMANAICRQVFKIPPPFDIPYEWLLLRGAKMSSSKGVGTSAREFVNLFPPQVARFLFVNKHYNKVIDFDPRSMAIPDLFDEYDQAAKIYWQEENGDQRLGRSFELAQIDQIPESHFLPRFRDVAVWMQYPEINLEEKFAQVKGEPLNPQEKTLLLERQEYAQIWLDKYAQAEYVFTPSHELPAQASELTADQKQFLTELESLVTSNSAWQPQDLQQQIYELAKNSLGTKPGFQAIYRVFLGKDHGPRAAWLLLSISESLRKKRLTQIS